MEEWQRLLAQGINNAEDLKREFPEVDLEVARKLDDHFQIRISRYFLDVLKRRLPNATLEDLRQDPLGRQVIPDARELDDNGLIDPLAEDRDSPVPNITHRYPDRVLFLVSPQCAYYCRFCTRKRKVSDPVQIPRSEIQRGIDYIAAHSEIRDVILSGGDPLMLRDEELEEIIRRIREIPHVELIRIGTRIPSALPQRVTDKLVAALRKYHPIYMMVHFNHPDEITEEAARCLEKLADGGFPLMNQSVLLRGVNDNPEVMKKLFQKLLQHRVRPYYLYQADLTQGTEYFRTAVSKGLEILDALRGWTSGLAVPYFVIDAPGGGGKIPLLPEYVVERREEGWVLRNYRGELFRYPDPEKKEAKPDGVSPCARVPAEASA